MLTVNKKTSRSIWTKRLGGFAALVIVLQILFGGGGTADGQHRFLWRVLAGSGDEFGGALADTFLPMASFVNENQHETYWLLQEQIDSLVPFYGYLTAGMTEEIKGEQTGQETIFMAQIQADQAQDVPGREAAPVMADFTDRSFAELLREENEAALYMLEQNSILPFPSRGQQVQVDLEPLGRYETLVQQFYTIDANTMAGSDQLNLEDFLSQDMTVDKGEEGPQILIYHTHSQEAFADSVPGDKSGTIMGVGEYLTQLLTDTYGYKVLHHTGQYDVKNRDDAYSAALPEVERILEENPSIQVVIDLHRDEMPEGTRLVTEVDGRPTARFMFFNGLSRTRKTGNIAYLYNENLNANLAFSFQMQLKAMEYYPGLTRKIYLKAYRYNMHLRPKTLLIELGAQNNTLEEALNACGPLAHILDLVLSGE